MFGPRLVPDDTTIPFMNGRIAGLVVSAVLSIGSLILAFYPGLNLGIDFRGGVAIEAHMKDAVDFTKLRPALEGLHLGPVELQEFGSPYDVEIRLQRQPGGDSAQQEAVSKVRAILERNFPDTTLQSVAAVGATVSGELFQNGLMALGVAMLAMLGYIWFRFEWQFGVAATATLVLDVTKIVGVYGLTRFEFNVTSIVAILTIMGYSINDKVVVYDRVRENLRKYRSMPLKELIDLSINETLSRTIGTSSSVFLAALPLVFIGGEALRPFGWVMLWGVALSTISSIMIAAPLLLLLGEKKLRRNATTLAGRAEPAAAE